MPINKATEKPAGSGSAAATASFYAAVRRVQTQRSAASISNGMNIVFGPDAGNTRKTLFAQTTRIPVKGTVTIPYGIFDVGDGTDKCVIPDASSDPMDSRSLAVKNYGARFPICTDAFEDAPGLEDFYMKALRAGLERRIDKNIIYTTATPNAGLVGIIGASVTGAAAAAAARGSVAVNNANAGVVAIADIQALISTLDPYSYSVEDLVILLNPATWQGFITAVTATAYYARIDQAARTLDGFQVFLSPQVPAAQAGVAAMANYIIGLRKDIELDTCGNCDLTIRAKSRMAGAMAGVGGGLKSNTTTNTGSIEVGQEGVYAAYLTGVGNT